MISLFRWQKEVFLDTTAKFNVIPAGRRTGKTQGGERAAIISAAQGNKCLWVDTINGNIDRYYERYFLPDLKENNLTFEWNVQKKVLKIEGGYIDFRSADKPESIEGFGYDKIYLNEAGIILNNDYLYINSILPMLMDYEDSQLFAFGTPKGKVNKKGEDHRFWLLWNNVLKLKPGYAGRQLSSYDNPILNDQDIKELEAEIAELSPEAAEQEIHGKFVDQSEDKVFNYSELEFFTMDEFNAQNVVGRLAFTDVADQGNDSLSMPIGKVIGEKVYVTDVVFSKENSEYTIPACASMLNDNKVDIAIVETNSMGAIFLRNLQERVRTPLNGIHQKTNKHSRIIQNAAYIRMYFVFRSDYEVGSDYDKFMRELLSYTKDGKAAHDDAIDSLTGLAILKREMYDND